MEATETDLRIYYRAETGESVGPFDLDSLQKLCSAGIVCDHTSIKCDDGDWQTFADFMAANESRPGARYFYTDGEKEPVGPVDKDTLRRLLAANIINSDTLIAADGDHEWQPIATIMDGVAASMAQPLVTTSVGYIGVINVVLTLLTLGLYWVFYLVPRYARDMEAITKKPRIQFMPAIGLALVTIGVSAAVMNVRYALQLGQRGQDRNVAGSNSNIGWIILGLVVASYVAAFSMSLGKSIVLGAILAAWIVHYFEKELRAHSASSRS